MMYELLNKTENDRVVFVENFKDLQFVDNLTSKQLCIIKTNFKEINEIKQFCASNPEMEVWLASEEVSRKNILAANSCGIKNVVSYPVETKLIHEFFRKKEIKIITDDQYINSNLLNGLKVIAVDDNQMNIDLLLETLSNMGLDISVFTNPIDALNAANSQKVDLILLDIMMPGMSGFELAEEIQKSQVNASTPTIFISALSDAENKIKSFDLGSTAYIEKPFDIKVVRSQIYNALKSKLIQDAFYDEKETFLTMITHDLKSPVHAEICALEFLINNTPKNTNLFQHEIVKDVLGAAKYMKNLLENVMNKYKFDNENFVLNKQSDSLKNLLTECVEEVKYLFHEKNQKIIFKCSVKNNTLDMDYIEIKRVVHNLLINAHQYGVKDAPVEIKIDGNKDYLICSIKNYSTYGTCPNPNQIFEKDFTQMNKQKYLGTGLGLYISKKIIDAHGGKIDARCDNTVEIFFTLPR